MPRRKRDQLVLSEVEHEVDAGAELKGTLPGGGGPAHSVTTPSHTFTNGSAAPPVTHVGAPTRTFTNGASLPRTGTD